MKKLTTIIGLCGIALSTFGQGTVNFNNSSTTLFRTNATAIGGTAGNGATAAQGFYFALLTAPSTVTAVSASGQELLSSTWTFTGLYGTNTAGTSGGRMAGGLGVATGNGTWVPGLTNSAVVVGWSSALGADWATIAAELNGATLANGSWSGGHWASTPGLSFFGISVVGQTLAGGGTTGLSAGNIFGPSASGLTPIGSNTDMFVIATIPEPSTFALAGLGAAALLIFRRRK